jgi:hypothetical protein
MFRIRETILEEINIRRLEILLLEEQLGTQGDFVEIEDELANDALMFAEMKAENMRNPIPGTPVGGSRFFA